MRTRPRRGAAAGQDHNSLPAHTRLVGPGIVAWAYLGVGLQ